MKQMEPVVAPVSVAGVEILYTRTRRIEDLVVARQLGRRGVREITEDREVDAGVDVAEGQDLHVLYQLRHSGDAGEEGRDDDHGARVLGDAGLEVEAGEPPRLHETRGHALHQRDGELARG